MLESARTSFIAARNNSSVLQRCSSLLRLVSACNTRHVALSTSRRGKCPTPGQLADRRALIRKGNSTYIFILDDVDKNIETLGKSFDNE